QARAKPSSSARRTTRQEAASVGIAIANCIVISRRAGYLSLLPPPKRGEGDYRSCIWDQRFANWKLRRALALPYFLRSTTRLSRVRKPWLFNNGRSPGS